MSKIVLNNISKFYKDTTALNGFNFTSNEDEFVVIVGPSGCGKTTLLRIIAGLEKPSSGSICLDGVDITNESPQNRDIAMVFQSYALYPNLNVYDNLAFPLTMRNVKKDKIIQAVKVIAEKLELSDMLYRKPGTLSGGQRQRVAIGRAMIRNPKVFLLDEPLSNLDASLREKMRGELISLHENINALFFYVTHDQIEAMAMGDRIIIVNHGTIQQIGSPDEVYNHPANLFVAGFIGTPRMNFFNPETYKAMGGKNAGLTNDIIVGIRPENIQIEKTNAQLQGAGQLLFKESFGKEIHFHVRFGMQEIIVCASSASNIADLSAGDTVRCTGNNKFHFFERSSGNSLKL